MLREVDAITCHLKQLELSTHSFNLNLWLNSAVANSPGDSCPGMHKRVRFILVAFSLLPSSTVVAELQLPSRNSPHAATRTRDRLHLPMTRKLIPKRLTLNTNTGQAGLGDFFDV
jgi:hypothetical protein